jgi:CheY-like chemotaxis protein
VSLVDNEVMVRVEDNGIGIAPDMLEPIFEMFTQGRRSNNGDAGLGVGLTLVRRLVQLHGGTVIASSDGIGKGSIFSIRLPRTSAELPAAVLAPPAIPEPARRLRILIVDDNRDAANSLAAILGLTGHEVRAEYHGAAAIGVAEIFRPEVMILDLGMPGMTGYEVAQHIRRRTDGQALLLIALTGWGQPEDRARSHAAGFDHHLVKPVNPSVLKQLLARFIPRERTSTV